MEHLTPAIRTGLEHVKKRAYSTRVDAIGSRTIWHYGDGGDGDVQFDVRTVSGWHEP